MIVMTLHGFFDDDVEKVLLDGDINVREIVFKRHDHGALLIHKTDVIALAKEFNLVVYEKNSHL